jgi:hypothetical protein
LSCFLYNASYFGLASLRTPISINKKTASTSSP